LSKFKRKFKKTNQKLKKRKL